MHSRPRKNGGKHGEAENETGGREASAAHGVVPGAGSAVVEGAVGGWVVLCIGKMYKLIQNKKKFYQGSGAIAHSPSPAPGGGRQGDPKVESMPQYGLAPLPC